MENKNYLDNKNKKYYHNMTNTKATFEKSPKVEEDVVKRLVKNYYKLYPELSKFMKHQRENDVSTKNI